jgi:hypothetical protein
MWQWALIAPLVFASAAYAAWAVAPNASRLRFARWLSRRPKLAGVAARLERAAAPRGSCESCPASRVGNKRAGQDRRGS